MARPRIPVEPYVGKTFDRLTFLRDYGATPKGERTAVFQCSCGKLVIKSICSVVGGHVGSCSSSCRSTVHGKSRSKEYRAWIQMKSRCENSKHPRYSDWGGRGITICRRWRSFPNFFEDMGECPPKHSLERVDNNKGYSPKNCCWSIAKRQQRNKRNSYRVTYKGKTRTLIDWADLLGFSFPCLRARLRVYGWTVEKAFTQKQRPHRTKENRCTQ
jgi:hypothetical protein